MRLVISDAIRAKLHAKHDVSPKDVSECFENRTGSLLEDDREDHRTDPPDAVVHRPESPQSAVEGVFRCA